MTDKKSPDTAILGCLIMMGCLFYTPLIVVHGWRLFVCPLGVGEIVYWQALGLMLTAAVRQAGKKVSGDVSPERWLGALFYLAFTHGLIYLVGLGMP